MLSGLDDCSVPYVFHALGGWDGEDVLLCAVLVRELHRFGQHNAGRQVRIAEVQGLCSVHQSVAELERDIRLFIERTNAEPKPFRWVKSADEILASVKRFCLRTVSTDQDHQTLSRISESSRALISAWRMKWRARSLPT